MPIVVMPLQLNIYDNSINFKIYCTDDVSKNKYTLLEWELKSHRTCFVLLVQKKKKHVMLKHMHDASSRYKIVWQ